jgi:hypothetical protein
VLVEFSPVASSHHDPVSCAQAQLRSAAHEPRCGHSVDTADAMSRAVSLLSFKSLNLFLNLVGAQGLPHIPKLRKGSYFSPSSSRAARIIPGNGDFGWQDTSR